MNTLVMIFAQAVLLMAMATSSVAADQYAPAQNVDQAWQQKTDNVVNLMFYKGD